MANPSSAWKMTGRLTLEVPYTVASAPAHGTRLVQFEVSETPVQVPGEGLLLRRQVVALVPIHPDWIHGLEDDVVGRLEDSLKSAREMTKLAGVKNFHGHICLIGDNLMDSKRFRFEKDDHRLIIEPARLMWPDRTAVELP